MTYRCEVCSIVSKPNQAKLTYSIQREIRGRVFDRWKFDKQLMKNIKIETRIPDRKEIVREVPVCPEHKTCLDNGIPLSALMRQFAEKRRQRAVKVKKEKPKQLARALTAKGVKVVSNRPTEVFAGQPIQLKGSATRRKS